jgi:hypothetical protein
MRFIIALYTWWCQWYYPTFRFKRYRSPRVALTPLWFPTELFRFPFRPPTGFALEAGPYVRVYLGVMADIGMGLKIVTTMTITALQEGTTEYWFDACTDPARLGYGAGIVEKYWLDSPTRSLTELAPWALAAGPVRFHAVEDVR